jgi:hypothetical protein
MKSSSNSYRILKEYNRRDGVVAAWVSTRNSCDVLEDLIHRHHRNGTLCTAGFNSEIKSIYKHTLSQFHSNLPIKSKPMTHWRLLYMNIIKDTSSEIKLALVHTFRLTSLKFK